ncbi:MAG: PilZ domain-containing protein [Myxococcales bacterium]
METAVHSGRREERVPLDALIELRSDDGSEVLEADGLDLSPGGLAMRAAFVPPVGAKLKCQFRCSPEGERVRAEGEVVWAHWQSDHDGAFGMRFLELDTKSATAIRRHVEPELWEEPAPEPQLPRVANMCIDGVGAPVETDVLFADHGSIVLEQELNFLKLGRGVSIDVPGIGTRRGRIGSVELRHGALDVPTLVFGILLDAEAEVREVVVPIELSQVAVPAPAPMVREAAPAPVAREVDPAPMVVPVAARKPEPRASQATVEFKTTSADASEPSLGSDTEPDLLPTAVPAAAQLIAFAKTWLAWLTARWARLVPMLKGWAGGFRGQTSQLRDAHWPEAKSKLAVFFARVRLLVSAQKARFAQLRKPSAAKRATAPAPRVQRSSAAAARTPEPATGKPTKSQGSRWLAIGLAAAGIALGVYALAPRSGADRIRVRRDPGLEATTPAPNGYAPAAPAATEPSSAPAVLGQEPTAAQPGAALPTLPVADPAAPANQPGSLSFGEADVPNGRTFSLRMSGPVDSVEGESRDDGFTVRVPGRLALDRASPIATSHRAVARAMILNRGDYAELTVDFLPGLRPKYQVVGKDAAIEVTLERL